MAGCKFDKDALSFYPNEHPDFPDETDITIVHSDYNEQNKSIITQATYIFLDGYLGELNFATMIDKLSVIGNAEAKKELFPISQLKQYLTTRHNDLADKYEGIVLLKEEYTYAVFEDKLDNGSSFFAMINQDLLKWDFKPTHPWILSITLKHERIRAEMQVEELSELLTEINYVILEELMESRSCLYIGKLIEGDETKMYFACKAFQKPSKILYEIQKEYDDVLELHYDFYKDKYWQLLKKIGMN